MNHNQEYISIPCLVKGRGFRFVEGAGYLHGYRKHLQFTGHGFGMQVSYFGCGHGVNHKNDMSLALYTYGMDEKFVPVPILI